MDFKKLHRKFHSWRIRKISTKNFILLVSVGIGIFSGCLAVSLKNAVYLVQSILKHNFLSPYYNILYIGAPIIGIALSILIIKLFFKRKPKLGISAILESITRKNGFLSSDSILSAFLGSILTVGFGGSVGLEAPAAQSAAGFSSNLSRLFHLNYKTRLLMIGCAASATLSAIFNAPIAALVFALEVFMLDLTTASIVPLLLASASATLTSHFIASPELSFQAEFTPKFDLKFIPHIILLGLLAGMFSAFFNRLYFYTQSVFKRINKQGLKLLFGALSLGLIIYMFPVLFGEGFEEINKMLSGEESNVSIFSTENFGILLILLVLTLFFKALACCITVEAGGIGGIFAPTLFMGSTLGYIFTKVIDFFKLDVNQGQFSLIGMSALVSGIIHAPLTGIFLIAEITGGYTLFIPLMISSSIAYLISKYYEPKSIYNKILEQQGDHISHHKDKIILNRIDLCKLIEKDFSPVQYSMSLGELVQVIKRSRRNIFPVVNEENIFMGIVNLDDVRDIMFNTNKYDNVFISDLIHPPTAQVDINTKMEDVMNAFKKSGAWNIVVTEDGKYCGFISRSKIFNVYRRTLVEFSDD